WGTTRTYCGWAGCRWRRHGQFGIGRVCCDGMAAVTKLIFVASAGFSDGTLGGCGCDGVDRLTTTMVNIQPLLTLLLAISVMGAHRRYWTWRMPSCAIGRPMPPTLCDNRSMSHLRVLCVKTKT